MLYTTVYNTPSLRLKEYLALPRNNIHRVAPSSATKQQVKM